MYDKIFEDISIKARVGYAINCLENVLMFYKCTISKWDLLLKQLWSFTSLDYNIDDWLYKIAEYLPNSVLEDQYDTDDIEYISESDFYELRQLYRNECNNTIQEIIMLIFRMGTDDLYSSIEGNGANSLNCIVEINNILCINSIKLPPPYKYAKFSFNISGGWGESFDGKDYSLLRKVIL